RTALALIQPDTGFSEPLQGNAASASMSPHESAVAVATTGNRVVVESPPGSDRTVLRNQGPGTNVSWDPSGTALFALIDGRWLRVPAPGAAGTVHTWTSKRVLGVPRLPGGPSFLSVSPARDYSVLYGVAGAGTSSGDGGA